MLTAQLQIHQWLHNSYLVQSQLLAYQQQLVAVVLDLLKAITVLDQQVKALQECQADQAATQAQV
jgi:hypothetical protein